MLRLHTLRQPLTTAILACFMPLMATFPPAPQSADGPPAATEPLSPALQSVFSDLLDDPFLDLGEDEDALPLPVIDLGTGTGGGGGGATAPESPRTEPHGHKRQRSLAEGKESKSAPATSDAGFSSYFIAFAEPVYLMNPRWQEDGPLTPVEPLNSVITTDWSAFDLSDMQQYLARLDQDAVEKDRAPRHQDAIRRLQEAIDGEATADWMGTYVSFRLPLGISHEEDQGIYLKDANLHQLQEARAGFAIWAWGDRRALAAIDAAMIPPSDGGPATIPAQDLHRIFSQLSPLESIDFSSLIQELPGGTTDQPRVARQGHPGAGVVALGPLEVNGLKQARATIIQRMARDEHRAALIAGEIEQRGETADPDISPRETRLTRMLADLQVEDQHPDAVPHSPTSSVSSSSSLSSSSSSLVSFGGGASPSASPETSLRTPLLPEAALAPMVHGPGEPVMAHALPQPALPGVGFAPINRGPQACPICNRDCLTQSSYQSHTTTHSEDSRHQCGHCHTRFSKALYLNTHRPFCPGAPLPAQ